MDKHKYAAGVYLDRQTFVGKYCFKILGTMTGLWFGQSVSVTEILFDKSGRRHNQLFILNARAKCSLNNFRGIKVQYVAPSGFSIDSFHFVEQHKGLLHYNKKD